MAIPTTLSGIAAFVTNFESKITAAPATYGLLAGDALNIKNVVDPWHAAYLVAAAPDATSAQVAARNALYDPMNSTVRAYYRMIQANQSVLDGNKVALGITLRDTVPTPIPPPSTFPLISLIPSAPGALVVRYADSLTPDARKRAAGSIGLQCFGYIGDAPSDDVTLSNFRRFITRQPFLLDLTGHSGKCLTVWARWQNAKGEEGPWSAPSVLWIS
jgi:hypothetical protein